MIKVLEFQLQHQFFPVNTEDWFPLDLTGWISLQSKGLSRVFFQQHSSKAWILRHSVFFIVQLSHPYMTTGKTIALTRWTFVGKVTSLLFNMLFRLVIVFLPRSKRLLISRLQSPSTVILVPAKNSLSLFPLFPRLFAKKWQDRMSWSSFFECWVISQLFHSPLSLSSRGSLVLLCFLP